MSTNGPPATTLVFLNDLAALPRGLKVRFLGCVTSYAVSSGTLTLQHVYPPSPTICSVALVDVNLLLSTLTATDTQRGEWVNVMGYIEDKILGFKRGDGGPGEVRIRIQAILLWSAGSINLGEYEQILAEKQRKDGESNKNG